MKIQHLADLHIEFFQSKNGLISHGRQAVLDQIRSTESDILVLAGDTYTKGRSIAWAADLAQGRPVVIVAGNHAYYGETYPRALQRLRRQAEKYPNVHLLENDQVEIGGVTFLGCCLWTDFALFGPERQGAAMELAAREMTDYQAILGFTPEDSLRIHRQSVAWLDGALAGFDGKPAVVVSHMAPSIQSIHDYYRQDLIAATFASDLEWLIEKYQPAAWIHGHVHDITDYRIGATRVMANCYGYDEALAREIGFDPGLVVEVQNEKE